METLSLGGWSVVRLPEYIKAASLKFLNAPSSIGCEPNIFVRIPWSRQNSYSGLIMSWYRLNVLCLIVASLISNFIEVSGLLEDLARSYNSCACFTRSEE